MAGNTPSALVAQTTDATGSGSCTFSQVENRFAVLVQYENLGDNVPTWKFEVSWDGDLFTPASPAAVRDGVFVFDVPALTVNASFAANNTGAQVTAQAIAYSD